MDYDGLETLIEVKEQPIEEMINSKDLVSTSLKEMRRYRHWSKATYDSYVTDVEAYTYFLQEQNQVATLENAKMHHIQLWIQHQMENNHSVATIQRRIAALSSIYAFYKELGVVSSNPFKAIQVPVGVTGHHSPILTMEELKEVYRYLQVLKGEGMDIEVTVKVLLMTGLRNNALTKLQVKDVLMDKQMLRYDAGIVNSKHKIQFFPLPPKLFSLIQAHIDTYQLQPEDALLHGLKGQALKNKQLNRITDKICDGLGWEGEKRVTPHGFRATIATILDERGNIGQDAIKFLLGHSQKENIHYYLRRDQRKINQLRKELSEIEHELEKSLHQVPQSVKPESPKEEGRGEESALSVNEDVLLRLLDTNPSLALKIIEKGYGNSTSFPHS